jgi:hypothetical protein
VTTPIVERQLSLLGPSSSQSLRARLAHGSMPAFATLLCGSGVAGALAQPATMIKSIAGALAQPATMIESIAGALAHAFSASTEAAASAR